MTLASLAEKVTGRCSLMGVWHQNWLTVGVSPKSFQDDLIFDWELIFVLTAAFQVRAELYIRNRSFLAWKDNEVLARSAALHVHFLVSLCGWFYKAFFGSLYWRLRLNHIDCLERKMRYCFRGGELTWNGQLWRLTFFIDHLLNFMGSIWAHM